MAESAGSGLRLPMLESFALYFLLHKGLVLFSYLQNGDNHNVVKIKGIIVCEALKMLPRPYEAL